jgi:DNA anti-recombination protein RmuC
MDSLLLVLIIGLIGMGLINAISLVWAGYLDRKLRRRPVPKHYDVHVEGTKVFPEVDRQAVEARAEQLLAEAVNASAKKLQASTDATAAEVANHIQETTTQELEKYHANLQAVSKQSAEAFQNLQTEITTKRAQLLKQLDEEVATEKTKRMNEFNAKLNDVVASYIVESLGNQVDIGAEAPYVFEMLATHKEDIKRDVLS